MTKGITAPLSELIALKRFAEATCPRPKTHSARDGLHLTPLRGRGMDFAEVRHYQAGDELRHMEWRVTARTGKPHIKLYQEERERTVILLTDFNPSMYFGTRCAFKSVIAARLSALLAWTVVAEGDRIGALLFSDKTHQEFLPQSREQAVLPLLAALERYTETVPSHPAAPPQPFSHALKRVRHVLRPGNLVLLLSDFYSLDKDCEHQLIRIRQHNDVLAYHVHDPLETTPPPPGSYGITDGNTTATLDLQCAPIEAAYRRWCDAHHANIQDTFQRAHIALVTVPTDSDLPPLIHRTFARKKHANT